QINHDPAHTFMNSGSIITGRPSMGSWVLYGLGAETDNLPGFVVLVSQGNGGQMQPIAARQWSAGLLPSRFSGGRFNAVWDPGPLPANPGGVRRQVQIDSIRRINWPNSFGGWQPHGPEIQTGIGQYGMGFKKQASGPALLDLGREPAHIPEVFGGKPGGGS